jgi:voltage-gated potassium channel
VAVTKDTPDHQNRAERWLDRNVARKGLKPRYAAYLVGACWLAAVLVLGVVERITDPKTYHTIWLAWWWAIQTVTTVGYGDVVPQSTAGKALAAVLMLGGLAFLSIITATITSGFIARRQEKQQERGDDPVMQQLGGITERLDAIEEALKRSGRGDG